jgi:hypothetical protein
MLPYNTRMEMNDPGASLRPSLAQQNKKRVETLPKSMFDGTRQRTVLFRTVWSLAPAR